MTRRVMTQSLDTYTRSDHPSRTYHQASILLVGDGEAVAWLYFSPPFPARASMISATLRLWSYSAPSATRTLTVRRSQDRPYYSRLTWDNQVQGITGPGEPKTVTKSGALAGGDEWTFDVTSHMQAVADGEPWYGWRIESSHAGLLRLYGADGTGYRADRAPVLEVEWADEPSQPDDLHPMGGLAVSVAKPTLRFGYEDVSGDTTLAAVRVQIASNEAMTSGLWDSGTVPATRPELDLSKTTYPGLADGKTVWWRVAVQDGAGLWSEWSEPVDFRRVTKGTLTLIEPSGGTIMDPTPVVRWSLTGRTQRKWQVRVARNANPRYILWDSGVRVSTETQVEIPEGELRWDDTNYRFTLYVWDNVERVTTPGDVTAHHEIFTVHFDDDDAVPTPDWITAETQGPRPEVVVRAGFSTTPDAAVVIRDNIILARLDQSEIAGGVVEWTDHTARPRQEATYVVRAIIDGRMSWGNPSARVTPRPTGIWLIAPDEGLSVRLLDKEEGTWEMGEESEAHVVGGRSVTVTRGLRGYEGSLSGLIIGEHRDIPETDGEAWRDRFLEIRRLRRGVRLVVADLNIPVAVWGFNIRPLPQVTPQWRAEFSFAQDGEIEDYT